MSAVRGPDVSSYQGHPDWGKVRAAGFRFAACKATEGLTYNDPTFAHNWSGIGAAGLVRIAYHFAHADVGRSPVAEADHFLNVVHDHGGLRAGDVPALDIEAGGLSGARLDDWIDKFCARVEAHAGRAGVIYSGAWYLGAKGAELAGPRARGWRLWTSAYGPKPTVYAGFTSWLFWQFTDGVYGPQPHSVPGIGRCDVSVFDGTVDQLLAFAHDGRLPSHVFASRSLKSGDTGTDVVRFQHALNHRLTARGHHPITADGSYGPRTEAAKHFVTYALGFPLGTVRRTGASKRVQVLIDDPRKRPKPYLAAALYRAGRSPK